MTIQQQLLSGPVTYLKVNGSELKSSDSYKTLAKTIKEIINNGSRAYCIIKAERNEYINKSFTLVKELNDWVRLSLDDEIDQIHDDQKIVIIHENIKKELSNIIKE